MSIVNRRNAMIGWATLTVVRRMAAMKAKKARGAMPPKDGGGGGSKGKKVLKLGAVVIALAGAAAFWKAKHRDSTDHDSIASEEIGIPDE
ncbi:MAG TPA: hypothetical protein VN449_00105 [Gaiellaceae bacterium]|jgi:hypothetical protein|nr:hypothetical protein [Gaiellaceae bacterium]